MKPSSLRKGGAREKSKASRRWIGVGMSSPECLIYRQRRGTSTKHGPSRSSCPSAAFFFSLFLLCLNVSGVLSFRTRETDRAVERNRRNETTKKRDHEKLQTTIGGEDQVKLASLSSGVEVALIVSASINWGKRCPHFLAAGTTTRKTSSKKPLV